MHCPPACRLSLQVNIMSKGGNGKPASATHVNLPLQPKQVVIYGCSFCTPKTNSEGQGMMEEKEEES